MTNGITPWAMCHTFHRIWGQLLLGTVSGPTPYAKATSGRVSSGNRKLSTEDTRTVDLLLGTLSLCKRSAGKGIFRTELDRD